MIISGESDISILSASYELQYPLNARRTGKNIKQSPIHQQLQAAGAQWVSTGNWDVPLYFKSQNQGKKLLHIHESC